MYGKQLQIKMSKYFVTLTRILNNIEMIQNQTKSI